MSRNGLCAMFPCRTRKCKKTRTEERTEFTVRDSALSLALISRKKAG
ncbi:MAG: hypothetical protein HWN70_09775 [Desulfobacterales bacterium]|nr:hypothetical protein [Desulfobacterales bacterium]